MNLLSKLSAVMLGLLLIPVVFLILDGILPFVINKDRFLSQRLNTQRGNNYHKPLSSTFELSNSLGNLKRFPKVISSSNCEPVSIKVEKLRESKKTLNFKFSFRPGTIIRTKFFRKKNNEFLFESTTTLDMYGRRLTIPNKEKGQSMHFLLFGGSYVFGSGLNDQETLTSKLNEAQTAYKSYSMSFPGYGPNDIIARLLSGDFLDGINPSNGKAAYLFIEDHFFRAIGAMKVIAGWGGHLSAIEQNLEGDFRFIGSYSDFYPIRIAFYNWLKKTNFFKYFSLSLPILTEYHYNLFANQISFIKKIYQEKFGEKNPFTFIFFPNKLKQIDRVMLRKALERQEIHYVDYSTVFMEELAVDDPYLPYDCHPNQKGVSVLSKLIMDDILKQR